jgi:hypothetical protein
MLSGVACSSLDDASASRLGEGGLLDGGGDASASPFADAAGAQLSANGIVLVHAASFPAFRICFEGALDERPLPSTDVMPESNVVGVDVGTAVRLPPHDGILGKAFVFPELALRPLYPAFGGFGVGPTCDQLFKGANKSDATAVGEITSDVSSGVHAFVLQGCRPLALDPQGSTARCGDDWTPGAGNLHLSDLRLTAYVRSAGMAGLPIQILQLSPALARMSAGRALGIGFGPLDSEGGAPPAPFIEGAVPFGMPVPNPPAVLAYTASDLASYATSGVFVTMGPALDDAGAMIDAGPEGGTREIVLTQSLEDIQRRSASRALPPDWFAVASSYVVVSVGEPNPRLADSGPDPDERRALHLLAIPLAAPDAGAPSGGDAGN